MFARLTGLTALSPRRPALSASNRFAKVAAVVAVPIAVVSLTLAFNPSNSLVAAAAAGSANATSSVQSPSGAVAFSALANQTRALSSQTDPPPNHHAMAAHPENAEVISSPFDDRAYRQIVLNNSMRVLLVSDPAADKGAAAMDVRVGQFSDPDDLPGLAHFLEHMLFLGTEKYPDENTYSSFLNEHGGSSNAYTDFEHTNYYFDVAHDSLTEALDIFAQFFIAPLFTESATDREANAVNNENAKNIQNDAWRGIQLEKALSTDIHPFHKFGVGSLDTLKTRPEEKGIKVRDELIKFHNEYYSASIMSLCVLGRQSLDDLETVVRDMFEAVPSSGRDEPVVALPEGATGGDPDAPFEAKLLLPYGKGAPQYVQMVPVKDIRHLVLSFPMPPMGSHYKSQPLHYLSHLIGHEGEGSILSELKARTFATALYAGEWTSVNDFSVFRVTIELTPEGLDNVDEVATTVFQYINMLRDEGPHEWIHGELKSMGEMTFRFKDKSQPINAVSSYADSIRKYAPADVLSGPYLVEEFDPEMISRCLAHMVPDNSQMVVKAHAFEGTTESVEQWYGVNYTAKDVPGELLEAWAAPNANAKLHLPVPNDFIPSNLDVVDAEDPEAAYAPQLLINSSAAQCWFKQDTTFNRPKTSTQIMLVTPAVYYSPRTTVLAIMYMRLAEESLNEYAYDAEIAGLKYEVGYDALGLHIVVHGYSDKLPLLLERVVERLGALTIDPDRFAMEKERLSKTYTNMRMQQPYASAQAASGTLIRNEWTWQAKLRALETVTLADVEAFYATFVRPGAFLEALVMGNLRTDDARALVTKIEELLAWTPLNPVEYPTRRSVALAAAPDTALVFRDVVPNESDPNSAVLNEYQMDGPSIGLSARLGLLAQMASERCFDTLRTKEQLGYIVWSGASVKHGLRSWRVIVQSSDHPADYLDGRIEAFLVQFAGELDEMSKETFEQHKSAYCQSLLVADKTLRDEVSRHWGQITTHELNFNKVHDVVAEVQSLSKDDLVSFFTSTVASGGAERRKLSVQYFAEGHEMPTGAKDGEVLIESLTQFYSSMPLRPDYVSNTQFNTSAL